MKAIFKPAILLFAGAAVLASPALAVATANGDLIIGFYEVVGGTVQNNTYVFNLGQASIYRENTQTNVSVSSVNPGVTSSNIGTDLAAAFGSDWASSGTVYWSIFGGADQTTVGVVNGDNFRTPYISLPVNTYVVGDSTTQPTVNQNSRGAVSNSIAAIRSYANGIGTNLGNANGALIAKSPDNTIDAFFPPTIPSQLTLGTELRGLFGAGTVPGADGIEGALDVYRYVGSLTDTDLTTGLGANPATLGTGQYIGTFTIDTNGNLGIGVVPEPSGTMLLGITGAIACLGYRNRRPNKLA